MARLGTPARDLFLVALALTVVAAVLYGPNALDGGFISDAWSNRSIYVFADPGGFFGGLSANLEQPNIEVRPVLAVLLSGLNAAFGDQMSGWLIWLVFTNVVMCLVLYVLLKQLRFRSIDAGAVVVLVLIFPAASALRLWSAMVASPVTITLALLGFVLALAAFGQRDRARSLTLHGVSLAFFIASVLLYELMLPLMLSSVLLYRLRVPWRPAIRRWAADVVVLLTLALTVTRSGSSGFGQTSAGGMIDHALEIARQTVTLFTTVILPFASSRWYVVALLALVPAVAILMVRRLPAESPERGELRRWLAVMGAGLLVVGLGYSIFIPGLDYYIPLGAGIANRVNAVPSIGWSLILYSGAMLASLLVLQRLPERRQLATGLALLGCALVACNWIGPIRTESDAYTAAFEEDERVLDSIAAAVPQPPPESTIWTFGQPVEIRPGIPVFGNTWDMTSSVQLTYDDPSLASFVALPGTSFFCEEDWIEPGGAYSEGGEGSNSELRSSYGNTYFVETTTGRAALLRTPRDCERAARSFPPSPALPLPEG